MKLRDVAKSLGLEVGCQSTDCIWGGPGGMEPVGGCRCLPTDTGNLGAVLLKQQVRNFAHLAQHLAAEVERMRPVAEAAQAWQHGSPRKAQALDALRDAVDAYEKAVKRG